MSNPDPSPCGPTSQVFPVHTIGYAVASGQRNEMSQDNIMQEQIRDA